MKVYVFPGQGSQEKGMGRELFSEFPELVKQADEILGYSIEELCLEDPEEQLGFTQYTQPALFIVNALTYLKKIKETGEMPDYVAGHSLGEYNALFAAGVFDFATGVKLVKRRGELMGQANGGAMAAVVGLTETKVREILQNNQLDQIDIANLNAPKQIVIASTEEAIEQAREIFKEEGASYAKLKVSAAFHSRYMKKAQEEFALYLKDFQFESCKIPVISNYTARPYEADEIVQNLTNQLGSVVRWTETILYLMKQGELDLEEIGQGHVLTSLQKKIKRDYKEVIEQVTVEQETTEQELAEQKIKEQEPAGKKVTETSMPKITNQTGNRTTNKKTNKTAKEQVAEWNSKYPVGTVVMFRKDFKETRNGKEEAWIKRKTRTQAKILFGHRAAIYVEGYNGYFALDEVQPDA